MYVLELRTPSHLQNTLFFLCYLINTCHYSSTPTQSEAEKYHTLKGFFCLLRFSACLNSCQNARGGGYFPIRGFWDVPLDGVAFSRRQKVKSSENSHKPVKTCDPRSVIKAREMSRDSNWIRFCEPHFWCDLLELFSRLYHIGHRTLKHKCTVNKYSIVLV